MSRAPVHDLVQYDLVQISGYAATTPDGEVREITEAFDRKIQQASRQTDFTTKYYYDTTYPIKVTFYQDGYGDGTGFPTVSADYRIESTRKPYDYTLDSYGTVKTFKFDEELTKIDPALSELNLSSTASSRGAVRRTWKRKLTVKLQDTRADAPKGITLTANPNQADQYLLSGIDSTMEYRSRTKSSNVWSAWMPCTGNTMSVPVPTTETLYQVRYRAAGDQAESKCVSLTAVPMAAAPSVSINWTQETFQNLNESMEIALGDQEYQPVTNELIQRGVAPFLEDIVGSDPLILKVRYAATAESIASRVREIKLYPRASIPEEMALDSNRYIVSGLSNNMQYMLPTDKSWRNISSKTLNLSQYAKSDETVDVKFRVRDTSTASPSKTVVITLPVLAPAPNTLSIDYINEQIIGFDSNISYQYRIGSSSTWNTVRLQSGAFSISDLISSSDKVLGIRIAPTASTHMSNAWETTLPGRLKPPRTYKFVYNDPQHEGEAVLIGVGPEWEYQLDGALVWNSCTEQFVVFGIPTKNRTCYVRLRATDSSFSSQKASLALYAPRSAPSASFQTSSETISVNNGMEYRIGDQEYIRLEDGLKKFSVTEYVDSLPSGESMKITFRYAATEKAPASHEKSILIYARRAAPTTVKYVADTQMIEGVNKDMDYRQTGTDAWKGIYSDKPFSVAGIVGEQTDVKLEFRYRPTSQFVASHIATVECY